MPRHIEQPAERHSKPASVKIAIQTLGLGLRLDAHRTGHDHRPHSVMDLAVDDNRRRQAQILDAAVRA